MGKLLMFVLTVGVGLSALALPPEIPGGNQGGGGGEPPGSGSEPTLTGVLQVNCETNILNGTLESTASDQNVILAQNGASLTVSNYTLNKSGDCSNEDNSNFYAVNAVVAAKTNATIYIDHSKLNSNAKGANCIFASGTNSTIYAYDCTIASTGEHSRGLEATFKGTVIASKMYISTTNAHCAALATDKGNGYISATDSKLLTAGNGSPLIYSTGAIEVNCVTGTATGAQIAGIEGLSVIRIKNSYLSGSEKRASEPIANGVIIYQSMSGDYTTGTATFEVADSTLKSAISGGAMFYITNTKAYITVQDTELDFDSDDNCLIMAAGNNCNNWGTSGSNGGEVVFTAIDQTLSGTVSVDGISSLEMYLVDSAYTGAFVQDTSTYSGDGDTDLYVGSGSTWTVTADCTLQNLTVTPGARIIDGSSNLVSIVNSSGTKFVTGNSAYTVTVSSYTSGEFTVPLQINDFSIDRTAFEAMYAASLVDGSIAPGETSKQYADAVTATNAAITVNNDKASYITVPAGVEESLKSGYLAKVEATVTSDNCIVVDLTSSAQSNEQTVVDAAVTNETVFASLVSTNASELVTITTTTPGLYYWIQGGTDVAAVTNAGAGVLSKTGGSVELPKPVLDATKGRAFFKLAAGVSAPVQSNDD